ncbi:MAG TPA: DUF2877 domain-containing protein [Candidatus Sulfomarinibacteraceae bacterium]|nr:DUF2877 domain-containing protein [Candidatus Sulfomarinibacteraceae bacterium]
MEGSHVRHGVLEATLVSDPVAPILGRRGSGSVHSVFPSVVNLELGSRLVTLAGPAVDLLPNGVRLARAVDFRRSGVLAGMPVEVDGARVELPGAGLTIDVSQAASWSPRLVHPVGNAADVVAQARWRSRAAEVRALASVLVARRTDAVVGLGALLAPLDRRSLPLVAQVAAPRLAGLGDAIRGGDAARARRAAGDLVGLGPGLTPSGDDALVGFAAAIVAMDGSAMGRLAFLRPVASGAAARTTAVAATFLRHAAAGEFTGGIHGLVAGLLGPDSTAIEPAVGRVLGWGATSGTDTLVGLLAGLDAAAGLEAAGSPATTRRAA